MKRPAAFPIGARVRFTPACDIHVLVGRVAVVTGHHLDGALVQVAMVDTGTRFELEPGELELVGDDELRAAAGVPPYVPGGDAQPARTGSRP